MIWLMQKKRISLQFDGMRLFLFGILIFISVGCKKRILLNKLEGTWKENKILLGNGAYAPASDVMKFDKGELKSWAPLTIYGSDTIYLEYQLSSVQHKIDVRNLSTGEQLTWIIEDIDKETMVARTPDGVFFFDKAD